MLQFMGCKEWDVTERQLNWPLRDASSRPLNFNMQIFPSLPLILLISSASV